MGLNGAESLIQTAINCGVEVCFANPGTTEMPLVAALDSVPGVRAVLAGFEGVCTGAADGYGRITGNPALTLLHLGPGFANGIANLHNARRAQSPVVNLIGEHASWHRAADPPLHSDIHSLASPVSGWLRAASSADSLAMDLAEAVAAARTAPGQVATLVVPHDYQLDPATSAAEAQPIVLPPPVAADCIDSAAKMLRTMGERAALFLGGKALRAEGLRHAGRIAAVTGCQLLCETFPARMERGAGSAAVERFPYFPEHGHKRLESVEGLVFAGARQPVTFFGYEGVPSAFLSDEHEAVMLAETREDVTGALAALADALNAPATGIAAASERPERPSGALTAEHVSLAVAAIQPAGAIIVDEGVTTTNNYLAASAGAPPFTYLRLNGGAIGFGMPCAVGAAIAAPERPVINIEADGSALYTVQALWTQARESLNVTTVICNNRRYRILGAELRRAGVEAGPQARALTDFGETAPDWAQLARGFGVPGVRVERAEDLAHEIERALNEPGPHLIEALL